MKNNCCTFVDELSQGKWYCVFLLFWSSAVTFDLLQLVFYFCLACDYLEIRKQITTFSKSLWVWLFLQIDLNPRLLSFSVDFTKLMLSIIFQRLQTLKMSFEKDFRFISYLQSSNDNIVKMIVLSFVIFFQFFVKNLKKREKRLVFTTLNKIMFCTLTINIFNCNLFNIPCIECNEAEKYLWPRFFS